MSEEFEIMVRGGSGEKLFIGGLTPNMKIKELMAKVSDRVGLKEDALHFVFLSKELSQFKHQTL